MNESIDLKTLSFTELEDYIQQIGMPRFKAKIIWQWIYKKFATDFEVMTNLAKNERETLARGAHISSFNVLSKKTSSVDRTEKYLFELADHRKIETVFIPSRDHNTLCVSSQVGCAQGCVFCATGAQKFTRNLDWYEILEQLLFVLREGKTIDYLVFMGMGEPLHNYDNLVKSLSMINDPGTLGFGARKITVSTSGVVTNMLRLADLNLGVNLAISLNASNNQVRSRLMPINQRFPIKKLLDAARYFQERSGRRITFEYVLFEGINDSEKDAQDLVKLMKQLISHVNLIVYNYCQELDPQLKPSPNANRFKKVLLQNQISVTVRQSMGADISGACGQLAGKQ